MTLSLIISALVMGLLGGGHCLAMCAAPCALIVQGDKNKDTHLMDAPSIGKTVLSRSSHTNKKITSAIIFHLGRLIGYSMMGAMAALAMEQLAWFSDRSSWLYPAWTGLHLGILFWGLTMLILARQPAWLDNAGRAVWRRVQPVLQRRSGFFVLGLAWALLPCGLLYSALQLAALSAHPVSGAVAMAAFGVGSGLWLWAAPLLWNWIQKMPFAQNREYERWATRAAGLLLTGVSLWALWMNLYHTPQMWCR